MRSNKLNAGYLKVMGNSELADKLTEEIREKYDQPCTDKLKDVIIDKNFKPITKIVYDNVDKGKKAARLECKKECLCPECIKGIRRYCTCNACDMYRSFLDGYYQAYFVCTDKPKIAELKHKKIVRKIKLMQNKGKEIISKIKAIKEIMKKN